MPVVHSNVSPTLFVPHWGDSCPFGYLRNVGHGREPVGVLLLLLVDLTLLGMSFFLQAFLSWVEDGALLNADILCCNGCTSSILRINCHFPNWMYDSFIGEVHCASPVLCHVRSVVTNHTSVVQRWHCFEKEGQHHLSFARQASFVL